MKRPIALFCSFALALGCASPSPAYESIRLGGEWFLNNQNEDFIYYNYDAKDDVHPDESHAMREMGALWSIYNLGDFLEDARYEVLAERGLAYFKASIETDVENGFSYVNITPGKVKLGYSGFMILNLLESNDPEKDALMESLAEGILFHQSEEGELDTFFYSDRSTGVDYYPGEALLALMKLYHHSGEEAYLKAVEKALPFYRTYFEENPNTAFIPWQTQAYYEYYQVQPSVEVADYIFGMNDYLIEQFSEDNCTDFKEDAGVVMAVYVEGMNKAYMLADERGDTERKACYARFIRAELENVMALQFPMEGQIEEEFGLSAVGGFFGSKNDLTMQVDRNQHATMALMGAYLLGLAN